MFACPVCDFEHEIETAVFMTIYTGCDLVDHYKKPQGLLLDYICKICGTKVNKLVPLLEKSE